LPTPTGFADEAEAFAAAEETYRAYVDALNRVDLSDPATFEDVYAWTTGDANATERETLTQMHADGWRVSGESVVLSVTGAAWDATAHSGSMVACVSVEAVALVNSEGVSMVAGDRPAVQTVEVGFMAAEAGSDEVLISELNGSVETEQCSA
jgi:hypothetical protein